MYIRSLNCTLFVLHSFDTNPMSFCYQVRGSLARRALSELAGKGLIKQVSAHRSQIIYTRVTKDTDEETPEGGVVVVEKKGGGGKSKKKGKAAAEDADDAE